MSAAGLAVLIPASNEAGWIGGCLDALLASEPAPAGPRAVFVIANGCRDATAEVARARAGRAAAAGWALRVIERPEGGKIGALNAGDAAVDAAVKLGGSAPARVYLDADVTVDPGLLAALAAALSRPAPRYATGRARIAPARSATTRAYARFWATTPFVRDPAPGFGLFALNAAGRARWGDWPAVISDDTFARLHFAPDERVGVPEGYTWPMVEGMRALVRVRRRQDAGVAEIARRFPHLMAAEGKPGMGARGLIGRALADPAAFAVYGGVALAVRAGAVLGAGRGGWARGR